MDSVYLVEASVEDPLDLAVAEGDSLDLPSLVFVVEGHRLAGGCKQNNQSGTLLVHVFIPEPGGVPQGSVFRTLLLVLSILRFIFKKNHLKTPFSSC